MSRGWVLAGRIFMASWALVLIEAFLETRFPAQSASGARLGLAAGLTGIGVVYAWLWLRVVGRQPACKAALPVAGLLLLITLVTLAIPNRYWGLFIPGGVIAGAVAPRRWILPVVLGVTGLTVLTDALRFVSVIPMATDALEVGTITMFAYGIGVLLRAYRELQQAREHSARLAKTEERLRLARDLHDRLGQTLALVVLKSDMVALELPADAPPSLRSNASDIGAIARSALDQLREVVSGYRQPNLAVELRNSAAILIDAGIECEWSNSAGELPPPSEAVLAWGVREAVTNVLRHSHASKCCIRLSRTGSDVLVEVQDNGPANRAIVEGNGLRGLGERLQSVGGHLSTAASPGQGVSVRMSLPVGSN